MYTPFKKLLQFREKDFVVYIFQFLKDVAGEDNVFVKNLGKLKTIFSLSLLID